MAKKYPTSYEIQEVLNSQSVTRSFINKFAQTRGVFLVNATKEELAKEISNHIYEDKDLEEIRELAYQCSNKQILSGFTISHNKDLDLEGLYNRVREYGQLKTKGYQLKGISKRTEGGKTICKGEIEYTKRKSGKIEFIQGEKCSTEFQFFSQPDGTWQVEVEGSSSSDGKEVMRLMNMIIDGTSAEINSIIIDNLSIENVITFFDRLSKEGFNKKDWKIVDIKQLTFKRRKTHSEIESEGEEDDMIEEEIDEKNLGGISQAVLDGRNLREHPFVKQAEKSGCIFTSMSYEFESNKTSKTLVIKAEFKGNPKIFEVSVINVGVFEGPKGSKKIYQNPDAEFKQQVSSEFWNNAKNIYLELKS